MSTIVYCIKTGQANRSYVGETNKFQRRIRQHNRELTKGAKATRGYTDWHLVYLVEGLPDRKTARQLEWRLHRRTPKSTRFGTSAAAQRAWQLYRAFQMEKFTDTAPLVVTLNVVINWHDKAFYDIATSLIWPVAVKHVCVQ